MRSWLKLGLLALVTIAAAEALLYRARSSRPPAGAAAPAFTLSDTDGRRRSLESLRGKVVAVNFWATWCGPCREEIPELSKVYAENHGKCFELLGVAEESGPRDSVVAAAQRLGATYPILLDEDGKAGEAFRVAAYPRTFLIDAGGSIRKVFEGGVDRDELQRALAPLLREAPAACPRA
jgi:cytochrome c biogenesis protein CcmG, thiol:disulfide interchange protein DsbE